MENITRENLLKFAETPEGYAVLNSPTKECVGPFPTKLINQAIEFVKDEKNGAVGLAAPQIGDGHSWFVMKMARDNSILTVINPKIIGRMGNKQYVEGCFSEKQPAKIKRAKQITVKFFELSGNLIMLSLDGRDAEVFGHEYDHLQGKLICKEGTPIDV